VREVQAIQVHELDGPRAVQVVEIDEPTPDAGQVLIEVHAAGAAFPDVLLSQGRYQLKPPPPFTLGGEIAGIVRAAPADSGFAEGDRVAALPFFGGFAEYAAVAPELVFPLPDTVGFPAAAALPINYLTAHFALAHRAGLLAGQTVLVHGAAGGVGTASIQFARALDATVIAVASTQEKADLARAAGAQHAVAADGFLDAVKDLTAGRGVDVVVDPVGGDRFTDSLRSLAREGQLLVIGFVGGDIPTVKVNRLLLHNTSVVGVAWGEYALANPGYLQQQWAELLPLLESGALDPPIGHTLALPDAAEALALMDERRAVGKVVLAVR
jgi:NADPH:quinone reductase